MSRRKVYLVVVLRAENPKEIEELVRQLKALEQRGSRRLGTPEPSRN